MKNPNLNPTGGSQFPAGSITDPNPSAPGGPIVNGFIPAGRIDPTAKAMIAALLNFTPNNGNGGYTYHSPEADNEDSLNQNQYLIRVDHNFGTKDLVFTRYFFNQDLSTGIGAGNINLPHDKYFRNQNCGYRLESHVHSKADKHGSYGLYPHCASSWSFVEYRVGNLWQYARYLQPRESTANFTCQ